MKRCVFLLIILSVLPISVFPQRVIKARSDARRVNMKPVYVRPNLIPVLSFVKMGFINESLNENRVLEAEEKAIIRLEIANEGKGSAYGLNVTINLVSDTYDPEIRIGDNIFINEIKPKTSKIIEIPIEGGFGLKSYNNIKSYNNKDTCHVLEIRVTEFFNMSMDPVQVKLSTLEYQKPELQLAGLQVFDSGDGAVAIVNDGKLQPGEQVIVKAHLQNRGNNVARNIRYTIRNTDTTTLYIPPANKFGKLKDLNVGGVDEIVFTLIPNKLSHYKGNLPIYIDVEIDKGFGGINNLQLPLAFGKLPDDIQVVEVKPINTNVLKTVIFDRPVFEEEKYIEAIQYSRFKRPNSVAIVIGVEKYNYISPAPYAERDADIITKYFQNVMGIDTVLKYTNAEVNGNFFRNMFDPIGGELSKMVDAGQTDVFVYYSGHGIPEITNKNITNAFLFPSDGKLEHFREAGYSINKMYDDLQALNARSVTVFMDACFSGNSRVSEVFAGNNIVNIRAGDLEFVELQAKPWENNANFRVFTSSSGSQVSKGFDKSQTGLFTYFICIGLQGDADLPPFGNEDKKITIDELSNFVITKVSELSPKIGIGGIQKPDFNGSKDGLVLTEID